MPIRTFHDDLPRSGGSKDRGWLPDATPRFGHLLAEAAEMDRQPYERARPEALFRHSDGGACSRAVAYAALDVPVSNPMDLAGYWVTELGSIIHDRWQELLVELYPEAEVEAVVGTGRRAGHVDAVVRRPLAQVFGFDDDDNHQALEQGPWVTAIEGKSVGGFAYQLAVGVRGAAQGPRHGAVVQACLNAHDCSADEAVIIYWNRDAISVQMAKDKGLDEMRRFVAEWTLTREVYEPIAQQEIARIEAILDLVDKGMLPARKIPDPELPLRHLIVDPPTGGWVEQDKDGTVVNAGTTWHCAYCRWQDTCSLTQAGRTPISDALASTTKEEDTP